VSRVVVLADTHIRRGSRRRLPAGAYSELERADLILHAGDLLVGEVLDDLRRFAPVHAVLGNNDLELVGVLPTSLVLEFGGVRFGMIHDSGPAPCRAGRLRRRFPDADVVVFGHSHAPWNQPGLDGQLLFNPGSPTERRAQPDHTVGVLQVSRGRVVAEVKPVSS